jgi:hypothetical protein
MSTETDYEKFLAPHLKPGFVFRELVTGAQNKMLPPKAMWPRILPAISFAKLLRVRMMEMHGAKGLLCVAAYRPKGGAETSQHKYNRALDLDLFPSDYKFAEDYATEAVRLFCEIGPGQSLGLGLYGRFGSCATIRVHIDVGKHESADRGWQIYGSRERGLKASDIATIAKREGLALP